LGEAEALELIEFDPMAEILTFLVGKGLGTGQPKPQCKLPLDDYG